MLEGRMAGSYVALLPRLLAAAALVVLTVSAPVHGRAAALEPLEFQPDATAPDDTLPEWRRSLPKALTYQAIVIGTDQFLYWAIITGTTASELEFLGANALTGIAYYVAFDELWHDVGLDPPPGDSQVNVTKAIAYRVFDTARAFGVTLGVGTSLTGSVQVAAAIAATRTAVYVLHDYAWSWLEGRGVAPGPHLGQ